MRDWYFEAPRSTQGEHFHYLVMMEKQLIEFSVLITQVACGFWLWSGRDTFECGAEKVEKAKSPFISTSPKGPHTCEILAHGDP